MHHEVVFVGPGLLGQVGCSHRRNADRLPLPALGGVVASRASLRSPGGGCTCCCRVTYECAIVADHAAWHQRPPGHGSTAWGAGKRKHKPYQHGAARARRHVSRRHAATNDDQYCSKQFLEALRQHSATRAEARSISLDRSASSCLPRGAGGQSSVPERLCVVLRKPGAVGATPASVLPEGHRTDSAVGGTGTMRPMGRRLRLLPGAPALSSGARCTKPSRDELSDGVLQKRTGQAPPAPPPQTPQTPKTSSICSLTRHTR